MIRDYKGENAFTCLSFNDDIMPFTAGRVFRELLSLCFKETQKMEDESTIVSINKEKSSAESESSHLHFKSTNMSIISSNDSSVIPPSTDVQRKKNVYSMYKECCS